MEDFIKAHKFSNNHMEQLKNDKLCGCFLLFRDLFSIRNKRMDSC